MDHVTMEATREGYDPTTGNWCTNFHTVPEGEKLVPSSEYFSARIENMMQCKSDFPTKIEREIESSKDHWSELDPTCSTDSTKTNRVVFEDLKKHPEWGTFFKDFGKKLVLGRKIAEGGQAEIYEAVLQGKHGTVDDGWVLKVFKHGSFLQDLQKQWPPGFLQSTKCPGTDVFLIRECVTMLGATLLEDGRFGFLMQRCWGDLRKLIDMKMELNHSRGPPFSDAMAMELMSDIAMGMKGLHHDGILHRDLKASNVLLDVLNEDWLVHVADFESSIGVVGTRFWRAPEILLALRNRNIVATSFTEKSDVYSYAMTCYEILTGSIPFEDECSSNYDLVLSGQRPAFPTVLDSNSLICKVQALIEKCWHDNPFERPTFVEILKFWDEPHNYKLRSLRKLLKMM